MKKFLLAAGTALLLSVTYAADVPDVREGLWSIHTQSIDNPGNKKTEGAYSLCRNHAFDLATRTRAKALKGCTMTSETFQSGKYSSAMHCVVGPTTIESKGTTTFQGDAAFHSETQATYTPALGGVSETTMIMDQKYVGSCPAGAQPGDRINADGTVMHLGKR